LRSRRVTALFLKETDKALSSSLDLSSDALSILAENVFLLQQLPFDGALHRIITIVKLRFSGHDPSLREFRISAPVGLQVLPPSEQTLGALANRSDERRVPPHRGMSRSKMETGESDHE
jgi:circadian clock protein KaiC